MRVVIIRAPVKPSPFILGSFTFRFQPYVVLSFLPPCPSLILEMPLLRFQDFSRLGKYFSVCRGTPRSFSRLRKRSLDSTSTSSMSSLSCKLEKEKKSHLHELLVIPIPLLRRHPLTDASTHNEFIKHREHRLLSRYKKGNSESEGKGNQRER